MSATSQYELDGGFKSPTNLLEGGTIANRIVVDARELVLAASRPIGHERFGKHVHIGFIGDLCRKQ